MSWQSALEDHPEHVRAIGMISIENANLELSLADILSAVLMVPKTVGHAVFFTPRAGILRVEILEEAAKARFSPSTRKNASVKIEQQKADGLSLILTLSSRSKKVIRRRHDVMHDTWGIATKGQLGNVMRAKPRDALHRKATPAPIQTLTDLVRDYRRLIADTDDAVAEILARPPLMADLRNSRTKSGDSA